MALFIISNSHSPHSVPNPSGDVYRRKVPRDELPRSGLYAVNRCAATSCGCGQPALSALGSQLFPMLPHIVLGEHVMLPHHSPFRSPVPSIDPHKSHPLTMRDLI
jgi:hypothetical protein